MTGLKKGVVRLEEHRLEWEARARETARVLEDILGDAAAEVRHVGSTAVPGIAAKPILDLAVAVRDFAGLAERIPALEAAGFLHRPGHDAPERMLFVIEGPKGVRTHHIHMVRDGGMDWIHFCNFTAYLRAFPEKARTYEAEKRRLAAQYPFDRARYTAEKEPLIRQILRKALVWSYLGCGVTVCVDRPAGSRHPKRPEVSYPINYGYLPGIIGGDGEELDVYILGVREPLREFTGVVVGIIHREDDVEDKLAAAAPGIRYDQAEIARAVRFQERYYHSSVQPLYHKSCGVIVWRRGEEGTEFLLLFQWGSGTWSVPKGHAEPEETELCTALREVWEETGLQVAPVPDFREEISYPTDRGGDKTVVLFLAEAADSSVAIREEEIAEYRWTDPDTAAVLLKHPGYRRILAAAEQAARSAPSS